MREKELRLALVCYGGISLAVYMHGITKEIWHLARASRAFSAGETAEGASEEVYRRLLALIEGEAEIRLRILVDIIAGASAGGLNGIFLAQAISSGQSLEPLTSLWLEKADVEQLVDPEARPGSRLSKMWATPIAWALAGRETGLEETVEPAARNEVKAKLASFVRGRWFEPPFGGAGFTGVILDALDAMEARPAGPPLLPEGQPLDLFVTVTDFHGHPERLHLHSPDEVVETEHRLTLAFCDRGRSGADGGPGLGDPAELAFAARATASFPGAFPPFTVAELDGVLAERGRDWPTRDAFLTRSLPRQAAAGRIDSAALIDGSVLANAPFRPAVDALRNRPARREIDRRFVYVDPHPGNRIMRMNTPGAVSQPGFFQTIFGAMSDIPREQPIRDNLEAIEGRSARINRMREITDAIRPEVEATIEDALGSTFFLDSPTPPRLLAWRAKAHDRAGKGAGYAYASYGHLKLTTVNEELAVLLHSLAGPAAASLDSYRDAIAEHIVARGLRAPHSLIGGRVAESVVLFFRQHDIRFRVRRLRFLARRIEAMEQHGEVPRQAAQTMREGLFDALAPYLARQSDDFYDEAARAAARIVVGQPEAALEWLAQTRDLATLDRSADERLAQAFTALPKAERRVMLYAYLGFPFYDIAMLPLLQDEGLDEFDPIKVDRISPEDARAIREGGAEASLKGIQFNSFGAFFSRVYRENDYLWGRLHGADRMIDIVASTLPAGRSLPPGAIAGLKRDIFRAILGEEHSRLTHVPDLFDKLAAEIG
ncbi:patatin-like protein [Sphingomonas oligoaromativorans]|uniref:patatin-like protein n=1 Tax=Sphingomonas oligoaromativorans TaxID=575322 RepID=UPI001422FC8F|nr:patatin-like protein [Sphingomonas oligoaromativorans]NIJ33619.1 patatin-related protein [Sphingomonas oligoaromativorans]